MFRSAQSRVLLAVALCALPLGAQNDPNSIQNYFTGKEVVLKIDMPGTQKGSTCVKQRRPHELEGVLRRLRKNGIASARATRLE